MHELIRQFAARELAELPEESSDTRVALLQWAVELAEGARAQLFGPEERAGEERLDREIHNLRAALDWALDTEHLTETFRLVVALNPYWDIRVRHREAIEVCGRLLALRPEGEETIYWSAVLGVAALHRQRLGELDEAEELHHKSMAIKEALGYRREVGVTLYNLALLAMNRGGLDLALERTERCLSIYREVGDDVGLSSTSTLLVQIHMYRGDLDAAEEVGIEGLRSDPPGSRLRAIKLSHLAEVARRRGDLAVARARAEEGLEIAETLDDTYLQSFLTARTAAVAFTAGDVQGAVTRLRRLLAEGGAVADLTLRAEVGQALALLARHVGDPGVAAELRGAAAALLRDTDAAAESILATAAPLVENELAPPSDASAAEAWRRGHGAPLATIERFVSEQGAKP